MSDDEANPFALITDDELRSEPRGDFPAHDEVPGRVVLSADEARTRARRRLEEWRRDHG